MFTGVRDPGHQRAQSYNYALCGPNHRSYSSGPGKVMKDVINVRDRWLRPGDPLQKRSRFFGHFGPKGVTN